MTGYADARAHLESLQREAADLLERKYVAGQREHGGKLWRKPQIGHIVAEVLDLVVYVLTLRSQLQTATRILDQARDRRSLSVEELAVLNLLQTGNIEGELEEELEPDTWADAGE